MLHLSQEDREHIVVNYFSTLFTSSNPSRLEEVSDHVETKVMDEMNDSLYRSYT